MCGCAQQSGKILFFNSNMCLGNKNRDHGKPGTDVHYGDKGTVQHAALLFEDLGSIRPTRQQHRSFKYALHSGSFFQLQTFVEHKVKLLGVPVLYVDPAYTSQDCSRCGTRGQRKRKDFKCPTCGHVDHAGVNAAFNSALNFINDRIDHTKKERCTLGARNTTQCWNDR